MIRRGDPGSFYSCERSISDSEISESSFAVIFEPHQREVHCLFRNRSMSFCTVAVS